MSEILKFCKVIGAQIVVKFKCSSWNQNKFSCKFSSLQFAHFVASVTVCLHSSIIPVVLVNYWVLNVVFLWLAYLVLMFCFQYSDEKSKFDELVEDKGVKILIDPKALMHVIGTKMDFVDDKLGYRQYLSLLSQYILIFCIFCEVGCDCTMLHLWWCIHIILGFFQMVF